MNTQVAVIDKIYDYACERNDFAKTLKAACISATANNDARHKLLEPLYALVRKTTAKKLGGSTPFEYYSSGFRRAKKTRGFKRNEQFAQQLTYKQDRVHGGLCVTAKSPVHLPVNMLQTARAEVNEHL